MVTDADLKFIVELAYLLNVLLTALNKLFQLILRALVHYLQMSAFLLHVLQCILHMHQQ